MSVSVSLNGTTYTIPQSTERGWGAQVTSWIQAVSQHTLQKSGGSFTLTAEVDFGATYGPKAAYFSSRNSNPSSSGIVRLANAESIGWRNNANSANLLLTVTSGDLLQFNSDTVCLLTATQTLTNKTLTSPIITSFIGPSSAVITPPSVTGTLATLDGTETLTNKALTSPTITISSSASKVAIYDGSNNLSAESTLAVSRGGTNVASYTSGDLLYASGPTTLSKLGIGSNGQFLKVTSSLPSWGTITGTLAAVSKTTTYTIGATDDVIYCNTSGGAFTLTLPAATGSGKVYTIKYTDSGIANALTVQRASSDTIQDVAASLTSVTLNTQGETIIIHDSASAVWQILERRIPCVVTAFTPTGSWSTNTTYTGTYTRMGMWAHFDIHIALAGAPTSAALTVNLPITIDTSKLAAGTNAQTFGIGLVNDTGVRQVPVTVEYNSTTSVAVRYDNSSSPTELVSVTQATPVTLGNTDYVNMQFKVPVSGWNG